MIELRESLAPLLPPGTLRTLDRDLGRWFMLLIQKRMRTGTVRADVVALATQVAQALDETPEGASLRASLPTLRRAAGLCPRCGQPFAGLGIACPACLSQQVPPIATVATTKSPPEPSTSIDDDDPDPFLEPDLD